MSAVLSASNVVAGYTPGLPIVRGVTAEVSAREIVTIIGPNGAGKSTFLKALVGLVRLESGEITLQGHSVAGLPAHEIITAGLGFVPQTGNIFANLTIHENLMVGGHTVSRAELKRGIERTYEQFPILTSKRGQRAKVLSGGQRQMLAIGRALMTNPAVLLLDEPTAGLAPKVVGEVFSDLRRLAQTGVAILMVEQNAKAALRISDRGYVLADGMNRFEGAAADLLADPAVGEAFLGARHHAPTQGH